MIPLTNDQLREQFRKIYGRKPGSMFELEQFRKSRPTSFYEPRTFKRKRKFRKSGVSLSDTPPAAEPESITVPESEPL